MSQEIKAALAGNPNCGKSTIFNKLTGAKQSIGNFPGVTVERYEGWTHYEDYKITLIDLPGVYSLSSYSDEERVAAEYLCTDTNSRKKPFDGQASEQTLSGVKKHENSSKNADVRDTQASPDVIINVVDASNLERNLYLTLVLKEQQRPMFVVLNMIDVAQRRGIEIDPVALSRELDLPVLTTIGNRGVGTSEILAEVVRLFQLSKDGVALPKTLSDTQPDALPKTLPTDQFNEPSTASSSASVESVSFAESAESTALQVDLSDTSTVPANSAPASGIANNAANDTVKQEPAHSSCRSCSHGGGCCKCSSEFLQQTAIDVARYKKINQICIHSVRSMIPLEHRFSDRVDGFLTNKYLGIPFFLLAMYVVFQLTFTIGQYPMDWLESGFGLLSQSIVAHWPEGRWEFVQSLLVNGIIGGVGGVLIFLPNILILFLAITLLEDSGYLARAALLCDRWMHKLGLHGRSIVPMLVGFGCTVPALMATRMLSDRRERMTTMFVLPLFSCGARLPIYTLLIPAFFPVQWRGPVLWMIYLIGIVLAMLVAKGMSLFFHQEEDAPFIIELPPYHRPTFRTVGLRTMERGWQYVKKAGTVILGISVLLWFLTNYPGITAPQKAEFAQQRQTILEQQSQENVPACLSANVPSNASLLCDEGTRSTQLTVIANQEAQARLEGSYAGRLGQILEPIWHPMGFDWKIGTALIGAFAAKEIFVAQMGIVYSRGSDSGNGDEMSGESDESGLAAVLAQNYSPLVGFCIMLFCLIASPCMVTFSMMAKESGSWKWAFAQWFFLTGIAWVLTTLVYQIGQLIF